MKLFISWSGELAEQCASFLKLWIRKLNHTIDPWCSNTDIAKGELARSKIANQLQVSNFGIVCVTRGNQAAPWLNFEAGALSKAVSDSRVMPFLIDLPEKDLTPGPLSSFQATDSSNKGQVWQMVQSINDVCDSKGKVETDILRGHFDQYWEELDKTLQKIRQMKPSPKALTRATPAILNELVSLVREQNIRIKALERRLEILGRTSSVTTHVQPDPDIPAKGVRDALCKEVVLNVHEIIGKSHVRQLRTTESGITVRCDSEGYRRAAKNYGRLQTLAASVGSAIEVTDDIEILVFEPL
ncbi:hypothetical protein [Microbispora hainanensis]|uniref:hypothetical protein n=1 Tax=Microbispora hainanensis TaxID=568844 RepID=UPI00142F05C7|nr:hypothetical protein [Microbispora hainanensis]